jgi:ATP-dependent Clp protease ATP-binding subunit ClpC
MFERFTERARQAVVFAQDEARGLKHNYIGTEHLLLGLLREEEGVAARVLAALEITIEQVRMRVAQLIGAADELTTGQIPFTPRAKKVLEIALREALSIGHNYIGTEHILLGLLRENEGVAARILLDSGVDAERVRTEIFRILGRVPSDPMPRGRRWRRPLRWQYQVVEAGENLEEHLNALGAEGWELVLRLDDGRLVFKRPAP